MIRLVEFFVRRYVLAISVFGALGLFGLVSALDIGVDLLPSFEIPIVAVTTSYPGAGSEEVVTQVSEPIEGALATLPGIGTVSSSSLEGLSIVIAEFNFSVDGDQAAIDVNQRVNAVLGQLPTGAQSPSVLKFDPNEEPILNVAVSAPGEDLRDVQQYAEDEIEPALQRIEGVADVSVVGPVEREIQVLLDPGKLELFGLSPQQVVGAIQTSAVDLPAGSLNVAGGRILLVGRNAPQSLADVEGILVEPRQGLRVSDVATVRDGAADVTTYARYNGEPTVLLEVQKQSGSNAVATADGVRAALRKLDLPPGYTTDIIGDSTTFISSTVNDTLRETLISVLVVGLIVQFFVGRLGSALSVLVAIPMSFAGTLIVMSLLGFTFNIITLLAVTVAVGLVVDDSIVIAENIDRYRQLGYGKREAVIRGAGEVSTAVLASTLSLLAVFLPISLIPGVIGQFFSQFGMTLAAMIFFSYLEALFFLTVRLAYLPNPLPPTWAVFRRSFAYLSRDHSWGLGTLRRPWLWLLVAGSALALWRFGPLPVSWSPVLSLLVAGIGLSLLLPVGLVAGRYLGRILVNFVGAVLLNLFRIGDALVNWLRVRYVRALRGTLARPNLVLGIALALFATLFVITPRIGFNFAPQLDSGQLAVNLRLPQGSTLDETNRLASIVEAELLSYPEVRVVQASVGYSDSDIGSISNAERASFLVELVPKRDRGDSSTGLADVYQERLRAALRLYPEAELKAETADSAGPPGTADFELTLASNDLELLRLRDEQARALLESKAYFRDVSSSIAASVGERVFVLDPAKLEGTGLTANDIFTALRTYNVGVEAATLRVRGDEFPIQVRADPRLLRDEQTLLSLPVFSPVLQSALPLREFGSFELREAPTAITRAAQSYVSDLTAGLAAGAPAQTQIRGAIERDLREAGILDDRVTIGQSTSLDLTGDLVLYGPIAFALALLLNYLVIASQFNSFRFPLYLLLTVPLALVGAFWMLFVTGLSLDINSVLGVVILIGLVTKNAILLLDVVISQTDREKSLKEALVEAGSLRLRPILMTTLTIVAVSLPLLLGLGDGSEFRRPLGLIIFGGVLSSAALTLFVIPAAFYRFEVGRYGGKEAEAKRGRHGTLGWLGEAPLKERAAGTFRQ